MDFVSDCIQAFFTALNGFEMDEMQVEGGQSAKPKLCQRWVKVLQGEDFLYANDPGPFEVHPTLETLETYGNCEIINDVLLSH